MMTPFRQKPVKWDGEDEDGRYENKGGFKFNIMTHSVVRQDEKMPKHFLADTPEEAVAVYDRYEKLLNNMAYSYAISTGLSKVDLFGESLIGLARAYRDWDVSRGGSFRTYAIYKIKDALNECVRENSATISVPAYVKKANSNLRELKSICEQYDIDWQELAIEQEIPDELEMDDAVRCTRLVENLIRAADRAKVDYEKFIDRVSFIPEDADFSEQIAPEISKREQERLEAALVVEKLKEHMDDDELAICDGIMKEKSFDEIGKELGKSKAWVSGRLSKLRDRIIEMMEAGTL